MNNFSDDNIACLFVAKSPVQAGADIKNMAHAVDAIAQRLRDIADEEGELKSRQYYHRRACLYDREAVKIENGCPSALARAQKYHDIYFLELFVTYDPPQRPFRYYADRAKILAFTPQRR